MGQEDGYYWNRIGAVELISRKKGKMMLTPMRYNGLNFRFHIKFNEDLETGAHGSGSVGILGLNAETIKKWASGALPGDLRDEEMFIRVYAGYEKDGPLEQCELFTMPYIGALPTSPPEMWLNFNCPNNVALLSQTVLHSPFIGQRIQLKNMLETLVSSIDKSLKGTMEIELKWEIPVEVEKKLPLVRAFDYSNMLIVDIIKEINAWGIIWLYVQDRFDDAKMRTKVTVHAKPLPDDEIRFVAPELPTVISADNGMIGFPLFGENAGIPCVTVKCLLRRDISIGDSISVVSKFMETPYKSYQVNEVAYNGEFRGQPWYVTYRAQANFFKLEEGRRDG